LLGTLVFVALALLSTGLALARGKPKYFGKHHTRTTQSTGWLLSYSGSSSWDVTEHVTQSNGDAASYNESSAAQWHYDVPKENPQAAGFGITYPTLCRQLRNYPCPPPQADGPGPGPSTFDFKIDDSISDPFAPPQTVYCVGQHEANTSALVGISATYVKGDDSYKIKIGNYPLPPELLGAVDPQCPGPNPDGVGVLDVWDPPLLPPGAPTLSDWWSAASVTIGARTFATYSQIDIPVSLSPRNGAPSNCGLKPVSGEMLKCKALGSWSGTLVLHRAPDR
jgi:hypothetical protein